LKALATSSGLRILGCSVCKVPKYCFWYRSRLDFHAARRFIPPGPLLSTTALWIDLIRHDFDPNPVWFYKLDLDPHPQQAQERVARHRLRRPLRVHPVDPA
jgi:hypothetical protein